MKTKSSKKTRSSKMKTNQLKRIIKVTAMFAVGITLIINLIGCSENAPFQPKASIEAEGNLKLAKKKTKHSKFKSTLPTSSLDLQADPVTTVKPTLPGLSGLYEKIVDVVNEITVTATATYLKKEHCYSEVKLFHPNGSFLYIPKGALTPPEDVKWGKPVTITINVKKDLTKKELTFTFGQSGCKFDPSAEVTLCWNDLGISNATLYYIDDDGNYIAMSPDEVDSGSKTIKLFVRHFSRYALAHSE